MIEFDVCYVSVYETAVSDVMEVSNRVVRRLKHQKTRS